MFYVRGSDIEKSAEKTDIEKTEGNSLVAEAKAQKSLTMKSLPTIGTSSMIEFHCKNFSGKLPTFESPRRKIMTFSGYLKHVSC